MKLYNKKRAADGWWRIGLGMPWIILAVQERGNWLNWIVSGIFIVGGIWDLVRARTKKLTEEERIELTDERNQMLLLQTKSRAYDIMNVLYVAVMIAFLLAAQILDIHEAWYVAIGSGLFYAVSMLVNSIVSGYYKEI